VEFDAVAGVTYWIAVDGYDDDQGDIDLDLWTEPPPPAQPVAEQAPPPLLTPPLVHPPEPAPAVVPAPLDTNPPTLGLGFRVVKVAAGGRVPLRVSCPAGERGGCTGRVVLRTASKVRATAKRAFLRLGSAGFKLRAGQVAKVPVRLSSGAQRLVTQLRKLRVRATFTLRDRAGNIGTVSRVFLLRK
jgi:hypothetical protein